jgi:hypothetical protein
LSRGGGHTFIYAKIVFLVGEWFLGSCFVSSLDRKSEEKINNSNEDGFKIKPQIAGSII